MHEAQLHEQNCFVTLTYGRDSLPPEGSLCHADFQKFMKRLRKISGCLVRYYMCGEYGPVNLRPHYHACLFGIDFPDKLIAGKLASGSVFYNSPLLSSVWTHGLCTVQPLVKETAGYCARYIMKKRLGVDAKDGYDFVDEDGVILKRAPEYNAMSLKPGIGSRWFAQYSRDVFPHDFVVADGVKHRVPRYYDRFLKESKDAAIMDEIEFARYKRAVESRAENTEARRSVREHVAKAKMRDFKRTL